MWITYAKQEKRENIWLKNIIIDLGKNNYNITNNIDFHCSCEFNSSVKLGLLLKLVISLVD